MDLPAPRALRASVAAVTTFTLALGGLVASATFSASCTADDVPPCAAGQARAETGACVPSGGPTAPVFAGAAYAAPDATGRVVVGWDPATDDVTPAERLRYRVYAATAEGLALRRAPVLEAPAGATRVVIDARPLDALHHVLVRAVDEQGTEDDNLRELSVTPRADAVPPTFAGLTGVTSARGAGVTLAWAPATDDASPPRALVYDVYAGPRADAVDFTTPLGRSAEGAASVTLLGLGAPATRAFFVVRARDVAGNQDANVVAAPATLGPEAVPPTFAGCASVVAESRALRVAVAAGADDVTPAARLVYQVFVAEAAGTPPPTPEAAPAASRVGAGELRVTGLAPSRRYFVRCRAVDEAGNVDANAAEREVTTGDDVVAPTFAGVTTADVDGDARTVTLGWAAASDDRTPAAGLVYDVYEATRAGGHAFDAPPRATSAPGALTVTVTDLPSNATLFWVVRARDAGGNVDGNVVALSGVTKTSFSRDVQPLFNRSCAVVGCHLNGPLAGGLSLGPADAYDALVGIVSAQQPPALRVVPSDAETSYLYLKITRAVGDGIRGSPMPAPGTGTVLTDAEKGLVKTWIDQGAHRN